MLFVNMVKKIILIHRYSFAAYTKIYAIRSALILLLSLLHYKILL